METLPLLLFILCVLAILVYAFFYKKKHAKPQSQPSPALKKILKNHVTFYNNLSDFDKKLFETRVQRFIANTRITGIETTVDELDKVLIAASAVIPIFRFPNWEYINLNEVLLYPNSFNETFDHQGAERYTMGLVGDGPYQNIMLLSKQDLRDGFSNKTDKNNTAIHEFVHLIDKTDGSVDGIPEALFSQKFVIPWLGLIHKKIKEILKDKSDINPYGATNEAEFFAVAAEYFFERPDLLKSKHPKLYDLLVIIFKHEPGTMQSNE